MSDGAEAFELGNFRLASGAILEDARLVYKTYGTLAADRSNVVLYPTSYGAQHGDVDWLIRPGGILDPTRYFVIVVNMFGNGLSTSPSHRRAGAEFPVTHPDNVTAQARLLEELFRIEQLALVYGWSMGAQQAYHWAVLRPDGVLRVAALCGTAKTSEHNLVFLQSLEAALTSDPAWNGHAFTDKPERGYRAFARIYASWAASQSFYRARLYRELGYRDLEDYLTRGWEPSYRRHHPADLLAMLRIWMASDVSQNTSYRGDLSTALAAVRAPTLVLASESDLYFTPEDCAADARRIRGAEYLCIPSIWGHRAGNPAQNPTDERFIRVALEEFVARA